MSQKTSFAGFNILGIIFMIVAISVGTILASLLSGFLPIAGLGGLIGGFVTGFCIYFVMALLKGWKMDLKEGAMFAVVVYVASIIATWIGSAMGLTGGIIATALCAIVASFLYNYVGKSKI